MTTNLKGYTMKPILRSSLLTIALAAGAAPAIADETSGSFAYDRAERTLYVRGEAYHVPPSTNTIELWSADRVTVEWEMDGDRRIVTDLDAERRDG